MLAATFGVGQVTYLLLWAFFLAVQIWLTISVFIDLSRSNDLSGRAKAGWVLLTIGLPILGILAYRLARGDKMRVHQSIAQADARAEFDQYIGHVVGAQRSRADEIARLAELRDRGDITAEEFQDLKAEVIDQCADRRGGQTNRDASLTHG